MTAIGADLVLLNGITVKGNVTLVGGGGPIPWSMKNDTIHRNVTVIGQTTSQSRVAQWLSLSVPTASGHAPPWPES